MKKLLTGIIALTSLISALAFAQPTTGYTTGVMPRGSKPVMNTLNNEPKTRIYIINQSVNQIGFALPGAPANVINSREMGYIKNDQYGGDTNFYIIDTSNNSIIFNVTACHYAIMTVYDAPNGAYNLDVESKFC